MNALDKIIAERKRQDMKWGEQNHFDEVWLAILTEEVGEASAAILNNRCAIVGENKALLKEVIQIAAVALAWAECHERRNTIEESE